jgi:epsilon-lactone hydrolase
VASPSPELTRLVDLFATSGTRLQPPHTTIREQMITFTAALPLAPGVTIEPVEVAGVTGERHTVESGGADATLLFVHGGAYVGGSPVTHRPYASHVAAATGLHAIVPDYRLAPEHPFPAGLDDVVAVHQALRATGPVVVAGDSAGGGLALTLLVRLRDLGAPLPSCAVLLSPWVDLALSTFTDAPFPASEVILSLEALRDSAPRYIGDANPTDPYLQPHCADLTGLPPLLIQVGDGECLVHDARLIAAAAEAHGVQVTLEEWPDCPHEWHSFAGLGLPESADALARVGAFTASHLVTT